MNCCPYSRYRRRHYLGKVAKYRSPSITIRTTTYIQQDTNNQAEQAWGGLAELWIGYRKRESTSLCGHDLSRKWQQNGSTTFLTFVGEWLFAVQHQGVRFRSGKDRYSTYPNRQASVNRPDARCSMARVVLITWPPIRLVTPKSILGSPNTKWRFGCNRRYGPHRSVARVASHARRLWHQGRWS